MYLISDGSVYIADVSTEIQRIPQNYPVPTKVDETHWTFAVVSMTGC